MITSVTANREDILLTFGLLITAVEEYLKEDCASNSDVLAAWGVILDMCVVLFESQDLDTALGCSGMQEIFECCMEDDNYDALSDILDVVEVFEEDSQQLKVIANYLKVGISIIIEEDLDAHTEEEIALRALSLEAEQKEPKEPKEPTDVETAQPKITMGTTEEHKFVEEGGDAQGEEHGAGAALPITLDDPLEGAILL